MTHSKPTWVRVDTAQLSSDWTEVSTPLLDRYNDVIAVYVKRESNDTIKISDDGHTMGDLLTMGIAPDKNYHTILGDYGITDNNNDELIMTTTVDNFEQSMETFLQAMLKLNHSFTFSS